MTEKTKSLSRAALASAAGTVLLLLASVLPTARLACICAASLGVIFVRMSSNWKWALGAYAVTALLGLLLCPTKASPILYAVFLGYYPLVKLAVERLENRYHRWGVKLAIFNAVFLCLYLAASGILGAVISVSGFPAAVIFLLANLVFLVYDLAVRELILFYIRKIARRIQ